LASQFRKLRTSLNFLGIEGNRKRVLVTSTISGEGKSFIAANLGITLATTGKKVVLLEFDLINPALSEIFNIHEKKGLSNYINEETEPEEIIKRSTINENLFIISSGPIPPNPSEMILSSKVEDLLNYLDAIFDYIIIDTAPVGPMTDAYTLSSYCDATLYVIRHKYTPKKFIQRIDEEMKIHPLKNVAIVFNGIRSRGFTKNAYGMGYGYGHEYIYKGKKNSKNKYIA
jgi:tyrosine-protein kinase Etk/Wzc